jgi:hypothetical protein
MLTPGKALPTLSFTTPEISFWAKRKVTFNNNNNAIFFIKKIGFG